MYVPPQGLGTQNAAIQSDLRFRDCFTSDIAFLVTPLTVSGAAAIPEKAFCTPDNKKNLDYNLSQVTDITEDSIDNVKYDIL